MHEEVLKRARRKPLVSDTDTMVAVSLGKAEIERMLPHRDPMLLVHRISGVDLPGEAIRAHRFIDPADPLLAGHFPGYPVYPGALLLESMGQAALCLQHMLTTGRTEIPETDSPQPVRLLKIHSVTFQAEARPGREPTLLARRLAHDSFNVECAVQAMDGDTILAYGLLEVFLAEE